MSISIQVIPIRSQVVPWNEAQKVLNVTVSSLGEPKHLKNHNQIAAQPKSSSSSSSTARPPPLTPSTPGVHYSTTYTPNGYFTTVSPYKKSSKSKKKYEASQVLENRFKVFIYFSQSESIL